jgi:hypothetical protein
VTAELVGAVSELVASAEEPTEASAELTGASAELAATASELLDSAAAERASTASLLRDSWLRGMSTAWLELEGVRVSLEVTDASLVGTFASALLAGPCVSAEPGTLSTELGVLLSGVTASPVADMLSSQALNANEAVIPSVTAMALLTFLFSIFINTSTLCTKIHFFEGKRL